MAINASAENFTDCFSPFLFLSLLSRVLMHFSTARLRFGHSPDALFLENDLWFFEQESVWVGGRYAVNWPKIPHRRELSQVNFPLFDVSLCEFVGIFRRRGALTLQVEYLLFAKGICFVPVDYDFPLASVLYRLVDAGVRKCICGIESMAVLSGHVQVFGPLSSSSTPLIGYFAYGKLPAYCLHTSGSTGVAKGVVISRESLCCYLSSFECTSFQWSRDDAMLFSASVSFDIAMTQRFWPWVNGCGRIVVLEQGEGEGTERSVEGGFLCPR